MKHRETESSSTHSRTATKHLTQDTITASDSKFDSISELLLSTSPTNTYSTTTETAKSS